MVLKTPYKSSLTLVTTLLSMDLRTDTRLIYNLDDVKRERFTKWFCKTPFLRYTYTTINTLNPHPTSCHPWQHDDSPGDLPSCHTRPPSQRPPRAPASTSAKWCCNASQKWCCKTPFLRYTYTTINTTTHAQSSSHQLPPLAARRGATGLSSQLSYSSSESEASSGSGEHARGIGGSSTSGPRTTT